MLGRSPHLQGFCGEWAVDTEVSDTIDPMLKELGVPYLARKVALMVKLLQTVQVEDNKFIVTNNSSLGDSSVVHMINAGPLEIKTHRGDLVLDETTFDPAKEYPLVIRAVLPDGKGRTTDERRVEDPSTFLQTLTYAPPKGKKPIVMRRVWKR